MQVKNRIVGLLICCWAIGVPVHAAVIHVDADATGMNDGSTWGDAHTSLSAALERASAGDEIWAAEGRYGPIELKSGVKVYGGFAGTEGNASASDPQQYKTYVDGGGVSRAIISTDNDSSTVVRGFYIVNGNAPEVADVGGGAQLERSSARFVDCVFANNTAKFAGGAVSNHFGGSPTFVNCRFHNNGGGQGRALPAGGGAFFNHQTGGAPTLINCLFDGNQASEGGAVATLQHPIQFVNCTFVGNRALEGSGGALFDNRGEAIFRNCILWNNSARATATAQIYCHPPFGTTGVIHSNVQGGWTGEGNISADPLFVDPTAGNYGLQANSPCRNAGKATLLPADLADVDWNGNRSEPTPTDLAHRRRVGGSHIDLGAFEYHEPD